MVVRQRRRGGWRREGLRTFGQREMSVDLPGRVIHRVNVYVRLTLADDFNDIRRRKRPNRCNVPDITAVWLRRVGVDVKHDLAGMAQIRVAMDMLTGFR